jgi:hypothetical protein
LLRAEDNDTGDNDVDTGDNGVDTVDNGVDTVDNGVDTVDGGVETEVELADCPGRSIRNQEHKILFPSFGLDARGA